METEFLLAFAQFILRDPIYIKWSFLRVSTVVIA